MLTHVCGQCSAAFKSVNAYLKHHCPATGSVPTAPQHFENPPPSRKPAEKDILARVRAVRRAKKHG